MVKGNQRGLSLVVLGCLNPVCAPQPTEQKVNIEQNEMILSIQSEVFQQIVK